MNIVFSRKAFDYQYGRVPNPIFPDAASFPLLIPTPPISDEVKESEQTFRGEAAAGRPF